MQQTPLPATANAAASVQAQALVSVEVTSATRLAQLESERAALHTTLYHTFGADARRPLEEQIRALDARVNGEHAKLLRVREELKSLQTTLNPQTATIYGQAGPFTKGFRLSNDQLGGAAGFLLLMPLMIAFAIRLVRRGTPAAAAAHPMVDDERFQRLEQAVDSIAVEVERISESQRFQARLSAEPPERLQVPR